MSDAESHEGTGQSGAPEGRGAQPGGKNFFKTYWKELLAVGVAIVTIATYLLMRNGSSSSGSGLSSYIPSGLSGGGSSDGTTDTSATDTASTALENVFTGQLRGPAGSITSVPIFGTTTPGSNWGTQIVGWLSPGSQVALNSAPQEGQWLGQGSSYYPVSLPGGGTGYVLSQDITGISETQQQVPTTAPQSSSDVYNGL